LKPGYEVLKAWALLKCRRVAQGRGVVQAQGQAGAMLRVPAGSGRHTYPGHCLSKVATWQHIEFGISNYFDVQFRSDIVDFDFKRNDVSLR
jgi:hypothetical protein